MKRQFYLLFLIPVLSAILAIQGYGFIYKAGVTLGCIFILLIFYKNQSKYSPALWLIFLAFIFSIAGDWFLSNKGDSFSMFSAGIGLYFLAHAGYLGYALKNGKIHLKFTIFVLVVYLVFFFIMLWPAIDNPILLAITLMYLLISCFSLGASVNLNSPIFVKRSYFIGITLILFSDTIISFKEFTSYQDMNCLILPTYYAAHIVITLAMVKNKVDN
jgi:uncharacterized membrane protein YhhN